MHYKLTVTMSLIGRGIITLFFGCLLAVVCVHPEVVDSNMSTNSSGDFKEIQDIETPLGVRLSGKYKKSFAYATIKDRYPVILTRVIDSISRNKELLIKKYGERTSEELKQVIGNLSQLRSEIMTNKTLTPLALSNTEKDCDASLWNESLNNIKVNDSSPVTWFEVDWIFCETYLYRRLSQIFVLTNTLSSFDHFLSQKQDAFTGALSSILKITQYTWELINQSDTSEDMRRKELRTLMKLNLWGNRCDLSHSSGAAITATGYCGPIKDLKAFEPNLLIDDTSSVGSLLHKKIDNSSEIIVDIILDNSGYELVTDLCLAAYLTHHKLATKIRFHVKRIPWFISDVTERDFKWTIESMKNSTDTIINEFGNLCDNHLHNGAWIVEIESFWTEPFVFSEMKEKDPSLYSKLSEAKLIIFKGDLNYRKLLSDINWDTTTDLVTALQGFYPSSLVTLRTIKADLCVGLAPGKAEELTAIDKDWLINGHWGLIHAAIKTKDN